MAMNVAPKWQELCRAAVQEQDPKRLLQLLREINHALAEQRMRTYDPAAPIGQ